MSRTQVDSVLGRVRQLLAAQRACAVTDRQLLADFIERRDELAFAALVHRHGAMVLNVCRRAVGHAADAEDAGQATFLVLARKAGSIRKRDSLASWLHGVAFRIARKLRASRTRRERGQGPLVDVADADTSADVTWREVRAVLDEELARLPDVYRAPLVMCYLEGKTQDEAARELGWTPGTLRGRLGRGRERLRGRLVRRGLTLSAALFSAILAEAPAFGMASAALDVTIVRSAVLMTAGHGAAGGIISTEVAALAQGAVRAMFVGKLQLGALVLATTIIMGVAGWLTYDLVARSSSASAAADTAPADTPKPKPPVKKPDTKPMQPVKPAAKTTPAIPDEKAIRDLIKKLGDEEFSTREGATKRLEAIGEPALTLLRKAAKDDAEAEVRQNARLVVRAIERKQFGEERRFEGGHVGLDFGQWCTRVAVTPDGKQAVSGGLDALRLWDIKTGKQVRVIGKKNRGYWGLAISKNGKRVIAGGGDRIAHVFELGTGKVVQDLTGHTAEIWGAALSSDGKQAVTGGWDQSLRVWNVDTGKEVRQFEKVRGMVRCLALSPNGKRVAAGHFVQVNAPATVRLWDLETGKEIKAFEGHTQEVSSVAFSSDGKLLLSTSFDGTIRLWDVNTGKELKRFKDHTRVEGAAITKDGKRVFSCAAEFKPTVRLWDVATGQQLFESEHVPLGLLSVAILPDDHHALTTGKDGAIRLWQWKK
jgi:RNA polymerase sigma factor (sigma-70 family)